MKKNFISSKVVIRSMAFTLLLTSMTGCYKDSRLDVNGPDSGTVVIPAAAYSISGTVTDAETGAAIENARVTTDKGTLTGGSGAYNVTLTKDQVGEGTSVLLTFEADNYVTTKRSVFVNKIKDGSTIVYPISVSLKKKAEEVKYVDVEYDLRITFVDAETGEVVKGVKYDVDPIEGGKLENNYKAGEYLIKSEKIDGYYASVTALSLPAVKVKEGENNVTVKNIVVELRKTPAPVEYVTISGDIRDVNNKVVEAKEISVKGGIVEPKYNTSNFYFKLEKKDGVKDFIVEAKVLNEAGDGYISVSNKVELKDNVSAYNVTMQFPFAVKNGQVDTSDENGTVAVGTITPELNAEGLTIETVSSEMSDGTTLTIEKGTKISNLGDQPILLISNRTDMDNTDAAVVLKNYTGLPNGVTFEPALKVRFNDIYGGELGESFELQYLNEVDNTWAKDEKGGSVSYANGEYTLNVAHFSTFRASMSISPKFTADTISSTQKIDVNRMNNEESALKDFKLVYNGYAGSVYANETELINDINSMFTNTEARELVQNSIMGVCPEANKGLQKKEYVGYTNIPGWTLLNNVDITTTKEIRTYTVEINKKEISFDVETIISVEISANEKNMTHIGHSHGHGDGDLNNTGGGIVVGE